VTPDRSPEEEPKVVVRDRRRIDPVTGMARPEEHDGTAAAGAAGVRPGAPGAGTGRHAADPPVGAGAADGLASAAGGPFGLADEVAALRAQVVERTADLQRVTAEYANYRKRVDRDRVAVIEAAIGGVLAALLPVLDDVDRARAHGDVNGAFKAVADQLEATLEKLGLQASGEAGEKFDPTLHEAVAHTTSPEVTEPTCVSVLRRGYRYGDRLLRAPLVAVADPAEPADTDAGGPVIDSDPVSPTDLPQS